MAGLEEFRRAVRDAGYEVPAGSVETGDREAEEQGQEQRKMDAARFRMVVAWDLMVPIILGMVPEMFFGIVWPGPRVYDLGILFLALPVLFGVDLGPIRARGRRSGTANMDSLIALGTGSSFLTSPASFFFPVANYARRGGDDHGISPDRPAHGRKGQRARLPGDSAAMPARGRCGTTITGAGHASQDGI